MSLAIFFIVLGRQGRSRG